MLIIIGEKGWPRLKARLVLLGLAIAMECLLLRLGFWQLARGNEKQAQIESLQKALREKTPINLADASAQSKHYQWARGPVNFRNGIQLLLDNQRRNNQVGVIVYQLGNSASGQAFLVELGWLPVNGARQFPQTTALHGVVSLEGLLLPPPSPGFAMGSGIAALETNRLLLTRLDMAGLATYFKTPLAARVLRVDPTNRIGYARDLYVLPNTLPPEKHRGYAAQWFGLAVAWIILCIFVGRRKKND